MKRLAAAIALLVLVAIAAVAQDAAEEARSDNGFLVNLLENRLSSPGRQIRLSGISGALSSRARIGEITISDDQGVWLRIDNAEIDWSRLALLRGRVNVNRLSAERIAWLRRADSPPQPGRKLPTAEAQPFSLPELPVAINVKEVALPSISFGQGVFGQAAELKVTGSFNLAGGALDTTLDIDRLDTPGGTLDLKAAFSNATRHLDLDVALHEPQGGVVATLLRIEGTPAIDLRLQGSGPLDRVDVTFSLDADGDRMAQGVVALRSSDDGLGFDIDFGGGLSPLVPREFRDFFAGQSSVQVQGVRKAAGGLRIDDLTVKGAVLDLSGSLETGADNFLRDLSLTGSLGDPAGPAVTLPVPGGRTRLHSAELYVNFGGTSRWDGLLVLDRLQAADIEMEDVTLRLGGLAQNLGDPARRRVTVNAVGLATGVWAAEPEVAQALGTRIDLFADAGLNRGGPIDIHQFQVSGNGLSIFSAGSIEDFVYTGRNAVRVVDLAIFAGLANRPLSGAIDLSAEGSVSPLSGGFDLSFDGTATDLGLGEARLDRLAAGETRLSGRAVRDESGFRTEDLRLENPQMSFASNGQVSTARTDIGFEATLADLSLVAPQASGRLTASGHASGEGPIAVTLSAAVAEGTLVGRELTGAQVGFDGEVDGSDVTGSLSGDASLGGLAMRLAGDVSAVGERRAVSGLDIAVGLNRLTGDVARDGADPVVGTLTLRAPELSSLAALGLVEATGSVDADIGLDAAAVGQGVTLRVAAEQVAAGGNRIGTLEMEAAVVDALGVPLVSGTLTARDLALAGVEVASISARAEQHDATAMRFSAGSRLAVGTLVEVSGALERLEDGFAATLESLDLRQQGVAARLTAPATVTLRGGAMDLTPLGLDIGDGNLTAQGRVAEEIDVNVAIRDLPLGIVNAIRPDLNLAGSVNGAARVVGPRGAPDVRFNLAAEQMASDMTRGAGLPPVSLEASGQTENRTLDLTASIRSGEGLAASATGRVPLAEGDLDLAVELQAFPLALIDRVAGHRGLRGTLTGRAHVTGPRDDPAASFDVRGEGLSAQILADNGIRPLGLVAAGSYHQGAVELSRAHATGSGGLDLQGSGRIPFAGPGLDVRLNGTVPLSVADVALAERSAQASGLLHVTATARGSLTAPQLAGTVSLAGGTLVDPQTNLRLENITIDAGLEGDAAVLHSFHASVAAGGTIAASGRVRLAPGYPADLTAEMRNVRYTDGAFVTTRINGDLAVNGPLVGGGGMLSGQIELGRTEISVAEGLGANARAALEQVTHIDPPPPVELTLERAKVGQSRAAETSSGLGVGLDIWISAPNQIFVRGRGLDVELGGALRIRGTTNDVQPVGQFDLRRGRLTILGQRIDFDEGSLQLVGNLDPLIHFVAQTESQDVTAIVTVDGRVSAPEISFSSQPPLPEDEVLSRVLFNRATQDLSAFQVAQLASAAAELAGGGGPGILSQLRGATGLDDLDIVTQEDGSTAVRAGKYIDDNIYLDVQTDTDGVSRVEINLDVSNNFTARGSVGTDGNTTLGLFFERDY